MEQLEKLPLWRPALKLVAAHGGRELRPLSFPLSTRKHRGTAKERIIETAKRRGALMHELRYRPTCVVAAALAYSLTTNKLSRAQAEEVVGPEPVQLAVAARLPDLYDEAAVAEWLGRKERHQSEETDALSILMLGDFFDWCATIAFCFTAHELYSLPLIFPPKTGGKPWPQARAEWKRALHMLDEYVRACELMHKKKRFEKLVKRYARARHEFSTRASLYWQGLRSKRAAKEVSKKFWFFARLEAISELSTDGDRAHAECVLDYSKEWWLRHFGVDCDGDRGFSALPGEGGRLQPVIAPVEEVLAKVAARK